MTADADALEPATDLAAAPAGGVEIVTFGCRLNA